MKTLQNIAVAAVIVGTGFLAGCSSSSSSGPKFHAYTRVAPLAAQTATISIADPTGTPVVTVTQPANMSLAVTATPVDANNVTLNVTATNNATRLLSGGKIVVNTISDNAPGSANAPTSSATGTTNDTSETFASLGFKTIPTGGSVDATDPITVTDLDGLANPLVITVTIPTQDHFAYGSAGWLNFFVEDINGGISSDNSTDTYLQFTPGESLLMAGAVSPDGQYAYFGNRNSPYVIVLDTTTLKSSGIRLTDASTATVGGVVMSSDGHYLYATYTVGAHRYGCDGAGADQVQSYIAKIDLFDNSVVGRTAALPIASGGGGNNYEMTVKSIALSGDESTLAVSAFASCGSSYSGMMVTASTDVDADGAMAIGSSFAATSPRFVALNQDGSTLYFVSGNTSSSTNYTAYSANIYAIDVASGDMTTITPSATTTSRPSAFGFGPDGRLYYVHDTTTSGLDIVDTSVSPATVTVVDLPDSGYGISFDRDGGKYYVDSYNGTSTWDITNDTMLQGSSGASGIDEHSFLTSSY